MVKVDSALCESWRNNPNASVDLIIHTKKSSSKQRATLEELGVRVRRRFRLTQSFGIRCNGHTALQLLDLPWITRIEPDRPVRTLRR